MSEVSKDKLLASLRTYCVVAEKDMELAEADGNSDYAFAEGAFEAYSRLIRLVEDGVFNV